MAEEFRAFAKLYITHREGGNDDAFGNGLVSLLRGVDRTGSLNKAAKEMHMAYSKAWKLMNSAEQQFDMKLIERDGARGSTLTPAGTRLVAAFDAVNRDLSEFATRRLQEELAKLPG